MDHRKTRWHLVVEVVHVLPLHTLRLVVLLLRADSVIDEVPGSTDSTTTTIAIVTLRVSSENGMCRDAAWAKKDGKSDGGVLGEMYASPEAIPI